MGCFYSANGSTNVSSTLEKNYFLQGVVIQSDHAAPGHSQQTHSLLWLHHTVSLLSLEDLSCNLDTINCTNGDYAPHIWTASPYISYLGCTLCSCVYNKRKVERENRSTFTCPRNGCDKKTNKKYQYPKCDGNSRDFMTLPVFWIWSVSLLSFSLCCVVIVFLVQHPTLPNDVTSSYYHGCFVNMDTRNWLAKISRVVNLS